MISRSLATAVAFFTKVGDYKAAMGQGGVGCSYGPDVRMVETRDRSNFFDDSLRERQKNRMEREGKERKACVGPFDRRGPKERGHRKL